MMENVAIISESLVKFLPSQKLQANIFSPFLVVFALLIWHKTRMVLLSNME